MKRLLWIVAFLMLWSSPSFADGSLAGWCELGGQNVLTSGLPSSTLVQQSFAQPTVNVFIYGTVTPATLFSDNSGTPLSNPFTASTQGYWAFFAANNAYTVTCSGGGIPSPFTLGPYSIVDPAGSGTVTGSGTTGTLPIWSSSTALGNSIVTQSGTGVTIAGTGIAVQFNATNITGTPAISGVAQYKGDGFDIGLYEAIAGDDVLGNLQFYVKQSGARTEVMQLDTNGLNVADGGEIVGSATGGFQGAGSINISGTYYVNGVPISSGGGISGSGTTNTIPKFTGSTAVGNSVITQPSTVSVNLASASFVVGDTAAPTPLTGSGVTIAIGGGRPLTASNTATSNANQDLITVFNNGTYSIIDSSSVGTGAANPISIQFSEVETAQFPVAGGLDMPTSAIGVSASNHGRIRYNSGTQTWQISANGGAYVNIANTSSGSAGGWNLTGTLVSPTTLSNLVQTGSSTAFSSSPFAPQLVSIGTTTFQNIEIGYGSGHLAQHVLAHSNGTQAAPSGTLSGDILGQLAFTGENAGATGLDGPPGAAVIAGIAGADWTAGPTSDPTQLSFYTTPSGGAVLVDRMNILSTGTINIDPTSALSGGVAAIQIVPASNGIAFATKEAITSDASDLTLQFYTARSGSRTENMVLDGLDSTTQTGLSLDVNGSLIRVLVGSCTVASGTHSCLYLP